MGRNNTTSHTAPTNKAFLEVKGHRRRLNWYVFNRVSVYCTKLNNDCQSPHKTSSSVFPRCIPLTPGKNLHLNTFHPHLHNTDKSIVLAPHVLMHFMSSPEPTGMNGSSPQEQRTSDESHPTQLLSHPHHLVLRTCGISLTWKVHPRGEGLSANPLSLFPLSCRRPQHHTAPGHFPHHRHWVKCCLEPERQILH